MPNDDEKEQSQNSVSEGSEEKKDSSYDVIEKAVNDFHEKRTQGNKEQQDKGESEEEGKKEEGEEASSGDEFKPSIPKGKFAFKADGKVVEEEDLDKIKSYLEQGFSASQRNATMKEKEKAIEEKEEKLKEAGPVVQKLMAAVSEGKIQFADDGTLIKGKEQTDEKEEEDKGYDEDEFDDPEVKKLVGQFKGLQKELKDLKDKNDQLANLYMADKVSEVEKSLRGEMNDLKKDYPLAKEKDIWSFLSEKDKADKPKFTVKEAMEKSHKENAESFQKYAKEHPELTNKEEIIQEYQKEQKEKNEAPTSPPSDKTSKEKPEGEGKKSLEEILKKADDPIQAAAEQHRKSYNEKKKASKNL